MEATLAEKVPNDSRLNTGQSPITKNPLAFAQEVFAVAIW
jgi:hypothetical protein